MSKPEFDLCVIGGGAAGLTVAAGAAVLGAKVALVEKGALGGDCLHYGCVPSKTLLHSAKVAQTLRVAESRLKEALSPTVKRWLKRLFGLRGRQGDSASEMPSGAPSRKKVGHAAASEPPAPPELRS